jgi:uncharacterized protein DUF6946
MDFENREGRPIRALDDWEHLGKPASSDHWKPGRSAYELARDWIDGDAADAVTALLSHRLEFSGIALIEAVAEKRTQFDGDAHGPRNHDLLVRAALPNGNPVTVAIEGKADETFDAPLWQYREKALRRSKDTGALLRIDALVHRWFGTSLAADRVEPPLICLGYQLFSALAGTLADAKQHGSQLAVLLIMEYSTDLTDDTKHADNARMLDHFLGRLIGRGAERTSSPGGWITKPTAISGDGTWSALKTDVAFGKLVRERRSDAQS